MREDLNHSRRIRSLVSININSSRLLPSYKEFCLTARFNMPHSPANAFCNGGRPQMTSLCSKQGVMVSVWCITNCQDWIPILYLYILHGKIEWLTLCNSFQPSSNLFIAVSGRQTFYEQIRFSCLLLRDSFIHPLSHCYM